MSSHCQIKMQWMSKLAEMYSSSGRALEDVPSLPLAQYQFKVKNGNPLNFAVENLQLCVHAKLTGRRPRKNLFQKHTLSEKK